MRLLIVSKFETNNRCMLYKQIQTSILVRKIKSVNMEPTYLRSIGLVVFFFFLINVQNRLKSFLIRVLANFIFLFHCEIQFSYLILFRSYLPIRILVA